MVDDATALAAVTAARLMVYLGQDENEDACIGALRNQFGLTQDEAEATLRNVRRERQDIDITDTHDDIMEGRP